MSGAAMKLKVISSKSPPKTPKKMALKVKSKENPKFSKKENPKFSKKENSGEYRVTADAYSQYTQKDHIYNITDSYIGSDEKMERERGVLDVDAMKIYEKTITLPEGIENLYIEILANAGDNTVRSARNNVDPGEIVINIDKNRVSIRNGGIPIPIEIHPVKKIWAPEMIFGNLLTSSNYDQSKVRTECGRNGFGAKLTNIFSKFFQVTVGDPHNRKHYRQVWRDNMSVIEEPVIKSYSSKKSGFVEIVYEMDFKRFGYTEFPDEALEVFARHAADMSFTCKVPVIFNGHKFKITNIKEYAKLYVDDEKIKSSVVYYKWPKGTEVETRRGINYSTDPNALVKVELCAVDTPDNAINVSFANGKWTHNGGVHAEAAFKSVSKDIVDTINNTGKGKKKERKFKITNSDVKKHVSVFVSCWVEDPKFDNQYKTALRSPTPKINIGEKGLKPILKWELLARLYAELDAKHFKEASKSDGKKRRDIRVNKLEDANEAGDKESSKCTLWITEGDSAMGFATQALEHIPEGRKYIGIFPLKGKPLNVMNATVPQISQNDEINSLKQALGLREGVNYLDDENFNTLRYGHLMILADSDDDGKHILGLVLNLFHCKYPTLLARNYVMYLRTKIVDVKKGKKHLKFYSQHDYDEWKKNNKSKDWKVKYFKGLGTSEPEDIEEEFKAPKIVNSVYDNIAPYKFQLAFDSRYANQRKDWIANWDPDYSVEKMLIQPISSFINHEFIQYSITDLRRSVPRFMDGLKISQRKILWAALKKWGAKVGKNDAPQVKVANFASYVSQECEYKHGEKSLESAIISMAQDFLGSNNMPYLCRHGNFGHLHLMGKDAAAGRYIYTKPEWWIPLIFKKEDLPLLETVLDEGKAVEPVTLLPIIPMSLINGCLGIGTGHSTFIPNHNPLDICYWIESKIKGYPLPEINPWYRHFQGEISIKSKETNVEISSETFDDDDDSIDDDEADVFIDKRTKRSMVTSGILEVTGNKRKKIHVKELPIGRSIHKYIKRMELLREKKIITKFNNNSTANKVDFEIFGMKNPNPKKLGLVRSFGLSNMVLLGNDNKPVKYKTSNDLLETFYYLRLGYYQKRKDYIVGNIGDRIELLNQKIRFIQAVIGGNEILKTQPGITIEEAVKEGVILVMGKGKKIIREQMDGLNFDPELLKSVTLYQCTQEEVQKSKDEITSLEQERKIKQNTQPEELWLEDLNDFIKAYCKYYKCKYVKPKKIKPDKQKTVHSDKQKTVHSDKQKTVHLNII